MERQLLLGQIVCDLVESTLLPPRLEVCVDKLQQNCFLVKDVS